MGRFSYGTLSGVTWVSYIEAREAVQRLGISTIVQYRQRYREVLGLPSSPPDTYRAMWVNWSAFLAPPPARFLPLPDAMEAVKPLAIQDQHEYRRRYREAVGLPSNPEQTYREEWPGWSVYLGKREEFRPRRKRLDVGRAQERARLLGLTTTQAYRRAVKSDPLLPRDPEHLPGWPGWDAFLGGGSTDQTWLPYEAARTLVHAQGWTDARTYQARYRDHAGLPQAPNRVYPEWVDWAHFLASKPQRFLSYEEACRVVRAAGIASFRDYAAEYRSYPGLPSTPNKAYDEVWEGWAAFLSGVSNRPS